MTSQKMIIPFTEEENEARMLRGEMYYAFTPELSAQRARCKRATIRYNNAGEITRREMIEMWKDITNDKTLLPPPAATEEEEALLLEDEPYIDTPFRADYGYNVKVGKRVYINVNSVFIDTCPITVGARTLIGPNCSFYSGGHPLDPFLRNGIKGPEFGKPIFIGEDCWLGGNVTIVPGVTLGRGVTVGAGSVVTKDVPDFHCVAGNPARVIRKIEIMAPYPAGEVIAKEE